MGIENLWQCSPESDGPDNQWTSLWVLPATETWKPLWPFTMNEVVERLNETLAALGSEFKFEPDPLLSNDHYAWMKTRDHAQAYAVTLLGRIVTQILMHEKTAK